MSIKKPKKSPKVLLVDDEVAILQALGIYLEQKGYKVDALVKFHDYLNKLNSPDLPDVIILDILLNEENGAQIAKELKANRRTKNIPIIMISALPDGKKIAEKARVDAYLAKPFDLKELNRVVEELTNKSN